VRGRNLPRLSGTTMSDGRIPGGLKRTCLPPPHRHRDRLAHAPRPQFACTSSGSSSPAVPSARLLPFQTARPPPRPRRRSSTSLIAFSRLMKRFIELTICYSILSAFQRPPVRGRQAARFTVRSDLVQRSLESSTPCCIRPPIPTAPALLVLSDVQVPTRRFLRLSRSAGLIPSARHLRPSVPRAVAPHRRSGGVLTPSMPLLEPLGQPSPILSRRPLGAGTAQIPERRVQKE
jgi:hypothetical protein